MVKIKDLAPGTEIKVDKFWCILLNPLTGYLVWRVQETQRSYDTNSNPEFSVTDNRNVGYYLNNTVLSRFSTVTQAVIKVAGWTYRNRNDVGSTTIQAKIGLLSEVDVNNYRDLIKIAGDSSYWLVTNNRASSHDMKVARFSDGAISAAPPTSSQNVRPAFYIDPNLSVVDGEVVYNTAPTVTPIPNQSASIGVNKTLNMASYFSDADGDTLTYTTSSSNAASATASVAGNILTLAPKQVGSVTITVTANDGKGGTVSATFTFTITNTAPTISGVDRNLGNFALPFTTDFTVNDTNAADSISVKVTLNGAEIMNINGAPRNQPLTIDITEQLFDALAVGSANTIQIVANDGNGGITYRTLTFVKTNTAPVITGSDGDLGTIEEAPTFTYSVSDAEGDAITVVERVNDVVIRTFDAAPGTEYTFEMSHEQWLQLWPDTAYAAYIEATDERGAKSVHTKSFKRETFKSVITLKNPFETDIHANRILLNPTVTIPEGAIFKAEACNNAFDDNPNWEDITERALSGKGYVFTFDVKTAAKWGVDLRLTLERGTATSPIILDGFGGAFD